MKTTSKKFVGAVKTTMSHLCLGALLVTSASALADGGPWRFRHLGWERYPQRAASVPAPTALATSTSANPGNTAMIGGKKYRFKQIDVRFNGVNVTDTFIQKINNRGEFVGAYYDDCTTTPSCSLHGFVYRKGHFEKMDHSDTNPTMAWGINDEGTVVGTFSDTDCTDDPVVTCTVHGFVWRDGKFVQTIDAVQNTVNGSGIQTAVYDISNKGDIVGEYWPDWYSLIEHGLLLRHGGGSMTLDAGFTDGTFANGINDHGQIVGNSRDLTTFGNPNGWLTSIRRLSTDRNDYTKIAFTQDDQPVIESGPEDINNKGTIVGIYCNSNDTDCHGFLYNGEDYSPFDVAMGNAPVIQNFQVASGINDKGQIVGTFYDSIDPKTGFPINAHGYIATPVK